MNRTNRNKETIKHKKKTNKHTDLSIIGIAGAGAEE